MALQLPGARRPLSTPRVVAASVATVAICVLSCSGPEPATDNPPNGSTDGRYHTCGYVTEDGVTEHLDAYWVRCPDERPDVP